MTILGSRIPSPTTGNEGLPRFRHTIAHAASGIVAVIAVVGCLLFYAPPSADAALTYRITNYDDDGTKGVYLRNSANINDVVRDSAHYVTYGTSVNLLCGTFGSPVGPYANTAWDQVQVVNGPNAGRVGYISEHWVNTPVKSGQHVAGEPTCGTQRPPTGAHATAAINWATGQLGSTAWKNLCLSFVRNAYASGGDDLKAQVSVTWGSNTFPQDIWGHFKSGTTGTGTPPAGALVFYLAKSGYGKEYSHVTIAVDGSTNTISSDDTYKSTVHRETIAQHTASGARNTYVGWWLPN